MSSKEDLRDKLSELYNKQYLLKIERSNLDHKAKLLENAIGFAEEELYGGNQQKMF
jgi:hypothetical protein